MSQLIPENVTKQIDSLGRVTLPKGLRDRMLLTENSKLEISTAVIDGKRCICLAEPANESDEVLAAINLLNREGYTILNPGESEDKDAALVADLKTLARNFYKLVEVNLKEDTYFEIMASEKTVYKSLRKWVDVFAEKGVYPRDRNRFLAFFDKGDVGYWRRIYYRRLIDNRWRWVCMEVVPTSDKDIAILVVRDVEDYIADWRVQFEEENN